jgi:hypothetical protein
MSVLLPKYHVILCTLSIHVDDPIVYIIKHRVKLEGGFIGGI